MPMVRAIRLLNAIEAGTTSGAQFQALLAADPGRLAEFNVLLGLRGSTRRLAASSTAMTAVSASSTAMTAVAASSTAMNAVTASSTAMTAVAASSTAMNAVIASSTAMTAVIASSTATDAINASQTASTAVFNSNNAGLFLNGLRVRGGLASDATLAGLTTMTAVSASSTAMTAVAASNTAKLAIYNSDTALATIVASSTALLAMRSSASYSVQSVSVNVSSTIPVPNTAGLYILLGISSSNNPLGGNPIAVNTRRAGSARVNTNLLISANATTATTTSLAIPLLAPFNATDSGGTGYTWNFGLLRCDV